MLSESCSQEALSKHRHLSNESSPVKEAVNIHKPPRSKSQENLSSSFKAAMELPSTVTECIPIEESTEAVCTGEYSLLISQYNKLGCTNWN